MKLIASQFCPQKRGLLILDLDGTLADTIGGIRDGVNLAMEKYGFPTRSYEEVRLAIGNGARELIRQSMPPKAAEDSDLVDRVFKDYHDFYGQTYGNCRIYDGISESLAILSERGYTLAVLSNKQDAYVKGMVADLFSEIPIAYVEGQTDRPKKPDSTVPLWMAKTLGFAPEETAFIGDSEVDVQTALNAGMFAVGCAWGYRERAILVEAGAHAVLDLPSELTELFV